MDASLPEISVIVVNYNSGGRLGRCLLHLSGQTFRDFEIIVADNASTDNSLIDARKMFPDATYIETGANLGFAAANNLAVRTARGAWIAFLNPDAYAEPEWLERLMAATRKYPWASAFGSTQLRADSPEILDGAGDVFHIFGVAYRGHFGWPASSRPGDGECFAPCAAAALYRRDDFVRLGGFDERFFCYGEDVDLGFRLRLAGGKAVQVADAIVLHEGSGVTGRFSDFTVYHGNRNRIWLTYKNMPGIFYWPLQPFHLATNLYLLLRAYATGTGNAHLRGIIDAYLGLAKMAGSRRELQSGRKASLRSIARAMTWSPLKVIRREADIRPPAQ